MGTKTRLEAPVSKKSHQQRKAIAIPFHPRVAQCRFPCFEVTVEFDQTTLLLVSLDLLDATGVWATFPVGMLSANGMAEAMTALRNATQNVNLPLPCPEPGCECHLPANKAPFSGWVNVTISGGFSLDSPTGGPPLQYRANGTVNVRGRVTVGDCRPVVITT